MLQSRLVALNKAKFIQSRVKWCHSGGQQHGKGRLLKRFVFAVAGVSAASAAVLTYSMYDADFRKLLEGVHPEMAAVIRQIEKTLPSNLNFDYVSSSIQQKIREAGVSLPYFLTGRQKTEEVSQSDSLPSETTAKDAAPIQDSIFLNECDRIESLVQAALCSKKKVVATAGRRQQLLKNYMDSDTSGDEKELRRSYSDLEHDIQAAKSADSKATDSIKKLQSLLKQTQRSIFTPQTAAQVEAGNRINLWNDELSAADSAMSTALKFENMYSEYREIAENGRKRYQKELTAVFPNVQMQDDLSDEELIALLAQAYVRLGRAETSLHEAEERQQRHLDNALSEQAVELSKIYQQKIDNMKMKMDVESERKYQSLKKATDQRHEEDLKSQLKQLTAAHSEHLEEALESSRRRLDAEHRKEVGLRLMQQDEMYCQRIGSTLNGVAKLVDILDNWTEHHERMQHSRHLLQVARNLKDFIVTGPSRTNKRRLKPLANDILQIKDEFSNDLFVKVLLEAMPDYSVYYGTCNEQDLKDRFQKVYRMCKRAAFMEESGGGLMRYLVSAALSVFLVEREMAVKADDQIELSQKLNTMDIISKANYCVNRNDFPTAIRLLNLLRGQPGLFVSNWIRDATTYAEALQITEDLVSHATVLKMRAEL